MQSDGFDDLLRRAQAGDREATDRLITLVRPHIERVARSYVDPERPDESVSDLVQQAATRVWQRLGRFEIASDERQSLAMFRGWITQIVRRIGLNAVRHRNAERRKPPRRAAARHSPRATESGSRASRLEPAASGLTPSANARGKEAAGLVRAAIARLPDPLAREIVRLRFVDGVSLRQIAEQLKLSYDNVREQYRRSMQWLQRELKGLE